jgi:hypothetical protein
MRSFLVLLFLLTCSSLWAGSDPIASVLPRGLSQTGGVEIGVEERPSEKYFWYLSQGVPTDLSWTAGGPLYSQKAIWFSGLVRWQASEHQLFELTVPYAFLEFSRVTQVPSPPFQTGDPSVLPGDGWGDIGLRWRLFAPAEGLQEAPLAGAVFLQAMAPTGVGPFGASHPWASTGQGTWRFQAGLSSLQSLGLLHLWEQGTVTDGPGYATAIAGQTPYVFGPDPAYYPAGNVFFQPGRQWEAAAGLGLTVYQTRGSRAELDTEIEGEEKDDVTLDGTAMDQSGQKSLALIPQFNIEFAHFDFEAGMRLPLLLVHELGKEASFPDFWTTQGYEPVFRGAYRF